MYQHDEKNFLSLFTIRNTNAVLLRITLGFLSFRATTPQHHTWEDVRGEWLGMVVM